MAVRLGVAWAGLVAVLAGCGAKTALLGPCTLPLEPAQPWVVVVADHSGDMGGEIGWTTGAAPQPIPAFAAEMPALHAILPQLDPYAAVGFVEFPDADVDALGPGSHTDTGYCALAHALRVTPMPHATDAIFAVLHQWQNEDGSVVDDMRFPSGDAPVADTLRLAAAAFDSAPPGTPRFIVLLTAGAAECDAAITPDRCVCASGDAPPDCSEEPSLVVGGTPCEDTARVVANVAALRARGIATLVLGQDDGPFVDVALWVATEQAIAMAGGLGRVGGPHAWYGLSEAAAIRAAVDASVLAAALCQLRAPDPPRDPSQWTLAHAAGGAIARDTSHVDGWDWVDAAAGTLRVWGPSCAALVAAREVAVLESGPRCPA